MTESASPVPEWLRPNEWLTPKEVADKLQISRTLVYGLFRLYEEGEPGGLRYKRLSERHIRVHVSWLHNFMERTRTAP